MDVTTRARVDGIRSAVQATAAATGCPVLWLPGWETRGAGASSVRAGGLVAGMMWHDTVTGPGWSRQQLAAMLRDGHANLSGPLCTFGLDRDGCIIVVAAGRAHHAGTGSWRGLTDGNGRLLGIEAANRGHGSGERWTAAQLRVADRLTAEAARRFGFDARWLVGHGSPGRGDEWTSRKSDPWSVTMSAARDRLARTLAGAPATTATTGDDAMPTADEVASALLSTKVPHTDESVALHLRHTLVHARWVRSTGIPAAVEAASDAAKAAERAAAAAQAAASGDTEGAAACALEAAEVADRVAERLSSALRAAAVELE